jgi:hypothetical protein
MPIDEWLIVFEDDRVLTQAVGRHLDDPFSTFDEWASEADTLAYASLGRPKVE